MYDHLNVQNMNEPFQSAYRKLLSTETALLKICSDVRAALERKEGTLFVLPDFNSAYDTIDHNILLNRLCKHCGVLGCALQWMNSYVRDRKQRDVIGQTTCGHHSFDTGVPHGVHPGACAVLTVRPRSRSSGSTAY